jgi:hypothetical protein
LIDPYTPSLDECRFLILKIIEQSVRDFISLEHASSSSEKEYYQTACQFLFNNRYRIDYGGEEKSLRDMLDLLDIEVEWFREQVVKIKDKNCKVSFTQRGLVNDEE